MQFSLVIGKMLFHKGKVSWPLLTALIMAAGWIAPGAVSAAPTGGTRYYAPTGHTVSARFLSFFDKYGGVLIFGYPISEEIIEGGRPVQYFERQRFEYHQEQAGTPNEVLLGRLGADVIQGRGHATFIPANASELGPGRAYFRETNHSVTGVFLEFWRANGDMRVLGYPVTEPVLEAGRIVQYFERARMEHHPERAGKGYPVELGNLGSEYVDTHPQLAATTKSVAKITTPTHPLNEKEMALAEWINEARRASGIQPVAINNDLSALALIRSEDMAKRNYFAHITPEGNTFKTLLQATSIPFKRAGEILAHNNYDAGSTVQVAYNDFMKSPSHRQLLLDPNFTLAGIGEAKGGNNFYFYTVIFVQR